MLPPAPPTFSITTSVIGREGKVCACAATTPARITNDSAAQNCLMNSPSFVETPTSVDFGGTFQRIFQFLEREVRAARDFEDRRLAPATELCRVRNLGGNVDRDH